MSDEKSPDILADDKEAEDALIALAAPIRWEFVKAYVSNNGSYSGFVSHAAEEVYTVESDCDKFTVAYRNPGSDEWRYFSRSSRIRRFASSEEAKAACERHHATGKMIHSD